MFKLQRLEITGFKSFADHTEIVFTGNGITAVVGPNGCGKCVSGDTLVTLSDGSEIEIKRLVENALDESFFREQFDDGFLTRENSQDVEILSLNPQTLKLETRKVSAFIKRQTTEKLLLVQTRAGREIKATPYHPLFTLENGKLRALRTDEIKAGVKIALPRLLLAQRKEIELTDKNYLEAFENSDNIYVPFSDSLKDWTDEGKTEFGSFAKWSQAAEVSANTLDGLRGKQSINIAELKKLSSVYKKTPNLENQIKSKRNGFFQLPEKVTPELARFLGLLIAEGRNTTSNQVWFVNSDNCVNDEFKNLTNKIFNLRVVQKNYKENAKDSLIFSKSLCKTLEKVFRFPINSNSFDKEIPPQILQADDEVKWAFLSGLFEGDAYVCARPQKNNGKFLSYIEYATASEKLAKQTISLLLQLGIFAYLRPKEKYAANTTEKTKRLYYSVLIYGSKQLKLAANKLDFVGKKQEALEKLKRLNASENPNRDLVPSATELVREAVKLAQVKIKPNRKNFPKIAAYTGKICEASRNGLNEVISQIEVLSENPKPAEKTLQTLSLLANSDVFWDEVVSVQEINPEGEWVYDLSIEETHNFVAGNIIVHNSNVSDGISWVLGEQKAKSLRGTEMADVIFQGTNKRQPSGMAEVVLHLIREDTPYLEDDELSEIDEALNEIDEHTVDVDEIEAAQSGETETQNIEGLMPETVEAQQAQAAQVGSAQVVQTKIKTKRHWKPRTFALDFAPGEAVSVTRRLYRSGESEYLLNGKICRLRDIQDLFSGTGLSGAHYALIEQGRIGQILSAKPSDRRTLIEEAAGISKFRTRQRAAETRLESAKTNLRRISDIVEEIEKQANSLRRQASKTRRYKILKEELRELLRQTFSAEGEYLTKLVDELKAKFDEAIKLEKDLAAAVSDKEETTRAMTAKARQAEEELSELRAQHAENVLLRDRVSRDLHYKEEQISNLKLRSDVVREESKETEVRLKLVKAEAERLGKDERKQNAEAEKENLELTKAEQKYEQKISEVNSLDAELENVRNELMQHATAVERFAEIKRQLESNAERLTEREDGLKLEGKRAEKSYAEHLTESKKLEKELVNLNAKVRKLRDEKKNLVEAADGFRKNLLTAEKVFNSKREEFFRVNNRLETLQEIEAGKAIYAPTVQTAFKAQKQIGVKLNETLADKLNVEKQAEKAVENVFGNLLQAILVESEADAKKILKYLDDNKLGRTAILVQSPKSKVQSPNKERTTKDKGQRTNLINYLGVSDEFAEILKQTFPRETLAQVVQKLDKVKAEANEIFVTLEGHLRVGEKLFIGGRTGEKSVLSFKRELRELASESAKLTKEIEKAERETVKARQVLEDKENQIVDLQSFIVQAERELLSQEIQAKNLTQETERAERHKKVVGDEIEQIERELAEIRQRQTEAETNSQKAEKAKLAATETLEKISKKLNEARANSQNENLVLNEKRTQAGVAAERRRSAVSALRRIENERQELEARLSRQKNEIIENENRVKELNLSIAEINRRIESAGDEQEQEQNELTEASANLKIAREKADAVSEELTKLNHDSAEARNVRAEIEVRQAETVTRLRNLNEICAQELNVPLVELVESVEPAKDFDLEEGRKQTDDLRRRIEGFGAVNMLALEELSEAEERLLFLTSQRQDIIDSIAAAEEALQEIKVRSRERFRHAFEAINRNFREFFVELFGGGNGEMNLLDAEDILESGIEIVAQPPGKRLQSILLLSGGEKAMTAIALVMAIFQYRPSPFCLLDEVDAPLDDANVGRFVNKIAQMSEKTQFIVITHNKRTMEAARALYGVTMQEAGVSKVVSVKFE